MVDKRTIALDNITSRNNKYKKLSDGSVIGVDILNDLSKYAELKLKRRYKININRWIVNHANIISNNTHKIDNNELKSLLNVKYNEIKKNNSNEDDKIVDIITLDDNSSLSDRFKKYITYNSVIHIDTNYGEIYLTPSIHDNDDPKEIAIADNDLMILNKIFKIKYSKSIDDMVLNSFYKEINDKLDNIKILMLENNNLKGNDQKSIIESIRKDLHDKLFAIYDIEKYQLPNQTKDKVIKSINDRVNKYNALKYKVTGGAGDANNKLNESSVDFLNNVMRDINDIKTLINDKIPNLRKEIYEKDIQKINEVALKFKSFITENNLKKSKSEINEKFLKKKENIVRDLYDKYKTFKTNLIDIIDKNDKNDKKSYPSNIFLDADIYTLNNNTTSDKYALLLNYIQYLKSKKKYGGAPNLNVKNDTIGDIFDNKSRLKLFNELKTIYITLITNYYKIIDEAGEEEQELNFLFDLENENESEKINTQIIKFLRKYNDQLGIIIENLKRKLIAKESVSDRTSLETKLSDFELLKSSIYTTDEVVQKITDKLKSVKEFLKDGGDAPKQLFFSVSYITTIIDKIIKIINFKDTKNINIIKEISKLNIYNDFSTLKSIIDNKLKEKEISTELDLDKQEAFITNKKNDIKKRIKILKESQPEIKKALQTLFSKINNLNKINLSEYEEYTKQLLQSHKLILFEENNNDNHIILKNIANEKRDLEEKEVKINDEIRIYDKKRRERENSYNDKMRYLNQDNRRDKTYVGNPEKKTKTGGGETNKNEHIYDISKQNDLDMFKQRHNHLHDLLIKNNNDENDDKIKYNFGNFMFELKNNIKDLESTENLNNNNTDDIKSNILSQESNIDDEKNIYETVWKSYNTGIRGIRSKVHTAMSNIEENEYLHDKVIVNNLDPELVLKINFQDKAIFLLLVFIIRTISVVILEFFIENNIIKTLEGSIIFYGFTYLFILFLVVFFVNYDSYKLRILLNYLNIHVNSSNLILQNILFIIFIILIFILVKSDDILKYFGYGFDYTNIYGSLYDYLSSFDEESGSNLSNSEKLKLLYRTDILSMIIFIFTGFLVLIL